MSRTLFWYILKDLLRIFLMASGVLAGIMSFGGLLRPLTEHGLNIGQVARMLGYFMPAMNTYALPIAALFATTMVYGRLAADNELVACRAAGISHLAMALPALVLGLSVAIFSLLLLCFIVPAFMLKAEKVVYSNIAQLVSNEIERTHQIKLDQGGEPVTVFAQSAQVLPADPTHPRDQSVLLDSPMFITYEPTADKSSDAIRTPRDIFFGRVATAFISQDPNTDELSILTVLEDGRKFPRTFRGTEGGVETTKFAAKYQSEVRENSNFMDLWRLKELIRDESKSRRVQKELTGFIEAEQVDTYLRSINQQLGTGTNEARITANDGVTLIITRGPAATALREQHLVIGATNPQQDRPVHVREERNGQVLKTYEAQQLEIGAIPDNQAGLLYVTMQFIDASERIGESIVQRSKFPIDKDVAMPLAIHDLPNQRDARYYVRHSGLSSANEKHLARARYIIQNSVRAELHKRVSFALSCLILVMIGCALGMMFRSGNFLSAFAISVAPALICIALIITGQHTCENVPWDVTHWQNSLSLGLGLIWSGNIAVAIIAIVLLTKLQRE